MIILRILDSKLASFWVRFARYKKVMSFVFSNFLASFPRFCVFLRAVMASEARNPVLPGCFAEKRTGARFLPFAALRFGMTQLGKVSRKAVSGDESAHWTLKIGFVLHVTKSSVLCFQQHTGFGRLFLMFFWRSNERSSNTLPGG